MEQKHTVHALWLDHIPGLGMKTKKELVKKLGDATAVYNLSLEAAEKMAGSKKGQLLNQAKKQVEPEKLYEQLIKKGISFYDIGKKQYPDKLKRIGDPPFGVYVKGKLPRKESKSIAIVGARVCSGYGAAMAKECGAQFAKAGIQVISGMARGVDGMSQWAACQAGGLSYGVLGCGVDVCYPEQNRELYEELQKKGGVISEYLPGTMPKPSLFPPRNRIISGLADALLVIEAREKSGTLITVDMALEQGRDVYVLPGRLTDSLSIGCNRLIGQGAGIVLSVEELIRELTEGEEHTQCLCEKQTTMSVYSQLDYYPKSVEDIQRDAGVTLTEAMYQLVQLCLEGKAEQVSSFYFVKN